MVVVVPCFKRFSVNALTAFGGTTWQNILGSGSGCAKISGFSAFFWLSGGKDFFSFLFPTPHLTHFKPYKRLGDKIRGQYHSPP
jgi:hypothetical protein